MPSARRKPQGGIGKTLTGIRGLDEITEGGLPRGRTTLVCGGPGCGKTVLGMEFLVHGALDYRESGVLIAFEETTPELKENFASMQFNLAELCARKKLYLEHVHIQPNEIDESGEYDLEGLIIRLQLAIDSVGAKRVVLDGIESLFAGFRDHNILRAELRRIFRWLKEKKVTAIVTGETGDGMLTRQGLEEYLADCVILLDHRVSEQNSIRRIRIVKYRGSMHGASEYPFLIGRGGFSVLPISSLRLNYATSNQRVSTGIPRLDAMLGGKGFFRGSTVLVSGSTGTGKSSVAAHFVQAACKRGERALYFASEQSSAEIIRNMHSIGVHLEPWLRKGLLRFQTTRAGVCGLENHLVRMHDETISFSPRVVVVDPVTNFGSIANHDEVKAMLTRLIDMFKARQITAMFTSLTAGNQESEESVVGVSSLVDTWIFLRNFEYNGERNRTLLVLKSRGMAHSNQVREFLLTEDGAQITDVYAGPGGVLTGSARQAQEAQDRAEALERKEEIQRQKIVLQRKRDQLTGQIANLRAEFEDEERALERSIRQQEAREVQIAVDRSTMTRSRQADVLVKSGNGRY